MSIFLRHSWNASSDSFKALGHHFPRTRGSFSNDSCCIVFNWRIFNFWATTVIYYLKLSHHLHKPSFMYGLRPTTHNLCLRLPFLHVTLCYLSHRRVRPKLYLQNKGALRTFFCLHTSQQPREFRGCSQKINMGDLIGNFADLPRTSQSESQPCFHINTHHRRKPIVELASLATGYGN